MTHESSHVAPGDFPRSGTGEVFGELALMDGGAVPRKATARCLDESELLFVSAEGFEEVKKYVTGFRKWWVYMG